MAHVAVDDAEDWRDPIDEEESCEGQGRASAALNGWSHHIPLMLFLR